MQQSAFIEYIERTAPPQLAASWDKSGVQVASVRDEVHHITLCLDPQPDVVETALRNGADFILSHHPLSLSPRLPGKLDAYHAVLRHLFCANVALYAAHTSLDVNLSGPVGWLARELDLRDVSVLEITGSHVFADAPLDGSSPQNAAIGSSAGARHADFCPANSAPHADACPAQPARPVGFGFVGEMPRPCDLDGLLARLAPWTTNRSLRLAGDAPRQIRRLAVCPGSGSELASLAAARGADLFITGDLKHHTALEAPLPILDMGHLSLEDEMMRRFALQLAAEMPALRVDFLPARDPLRPLCPTLQPAQENA